MAGLRDELLAVREKHGRLTPQLVVEEWRPEDHPSHRRLEWDDRVAGEAWRREQAHRLIQSVRAVRPDGTVAHDVRMFTAFPAPDSPQPVYLLPEEIALDPQTRAVAEATMQREWRTLRRRWESNRDFWDMVAADLTERSA